MILHELLERAEPRGYASIVRWQEHGRAFRIYNRKGMIEKVLPLYFERQGAYTSFQRQLNSYGFLRLNDDGPDQKAYYHELFLRGKANLAVCMVRGCSSNSRMRRRWDPTTEPNLCELAPLPPSSWRTQSSLGTNRQMAFSLQMSEAASRGNAQNEPKRQKQEATMDQEDCFFSHTLDTDTDLSELCNLKDEPQCASLNPLSSSQHSGHTSSDYSPVNLANSQYAMGVPPGLHRLDHAVGSIELSCEAQSLDRALLHQGLPSTSAAADGNYIATTTRERPSGQTTTSMFASNVAAQARPPCSTELVERHENSVYRSTASTGPFTYDRLFSDRLLRAAAALPVQLAATAAADTAGYNHHASMHVNNSAAISSLGSSQGSISLSSQPHTIGLPSVPHTTFAGRAFDTFPSWRVPSALSVKPAGSGGQSMRHHSAIDRRTAPQSQGFNRHSLMHVHNPAVSLGSTIPSSQAHPLACRQVRHTTLEGRVGHGLRAAPRVSLNEIEPLSAQFPSSRLSTALFFKPAGDGPTVHHNSHMPGQEQHHGPFPTMQEPSRSTGKDRGMDSLSPACHNPPYPQPRRSTETCHSDPPARNEFIFHHLPLPRTEFDDLTDATLGDVEETDALSACSCSSTPHCETD
jgi:HSF-type DNA-binding